MKSYKKYIFDLDYTLLIPDWSNEDSYFKKTVPLEEQEEFFKQKQSILKSYEVNFPKYDLKTLSEFLKTFGFHLDEEVLLGWKKHNSMTIVDEVVDGAKDLLKYLSARDKEIVILTSGFGETQIERIKKAGLYKYIDLFVTGEDAMKPDLESFELAIGDTNKEDCIMIGDSIMSDKVGADNAGIDSYIVDKEHTLRDFYHKVIGRDIKTKRLVMQTKIYKDI